jgi:1D-myo-inositol-triphosphate 3-kinase
MQVPLVMACCHVQIRVQIGGRTYQQKEIDDKEPRKDMWGKLSENDQKLDHWTQKEKGDKAITKERYLDFRDSESTTATLNFRIEGMKVR